MASNYQLGYDDARFELIVDQNFHCLICRNVLKDPVMCRRNQHYFCRGCITEHLRRNSHTCPACPDGLSVDTCALAEVPKNVTDYLDERRIRCDHYDKGCRELVQLQHLKRHVDECGFTPVVCGNQGCGETISKRARTRHESELCQFRKLKCHNCEEISTMMARMETRMANLDTKMANLDTKMANLDTKMGHTDTKLNNMDTKLTNVDTQMKDMNTRMANTNTEQEKMETKINQHIFVAGGESRNSVEIFNCRQRVWSLFKPMPDERYGASSFIYNNHAILAGGRCPGVGSVDNMIQMKIHPILDLSINWSNFAAKLLAKMFVHSSVVYKDSLLVTGGRETDQCAFSDCIHEVQLKPPHTVKLVSRMPESRAYHSTVLCDDSILIFGGRKSFNCQDTLSSVLSYDIKKNECRHLPALPYPVSEMATVKWSENVVIIGGADKDGKALNNVIIYNIKTGNSHMLPPMLHKRRGCMAVVVENTIVVLGGTDEEGFCSKSVECFNFERFSWEELPDMKEARWLAAAVVI